MRLLPFLFACIFSLPENTLAQALPIAIDGLFDDWGSTSLELSDEANDDSGVDFLRCEVANDEEFLFLQLELANELDLTENNEITLYLDTDLNANTGEFINGIGAELAIVFGDREATYDLPSGNGLLELNDIDFHHLPTVTATRFEVAIDRHAISNAGAQLFLSGGLRLFWKDEDGPNGDQMPEDGTVFTYQFDETPTAPYTPVLLEKEDPSLLRLLTWNTLSDGLEDIDRAPRFDRVIGALLPDIVTFNECWDMTAPQVASFMNSAAPLGGFQSWHAAKLDQGNVTVSRWPILQNWAAYPGHRLTASLIDLPDDDFDTDILVVNGHFKCCGDGDFDRQREADAFIQFILDATSPGGIIDLPENTPFLLSGDLNLVGQGQQLTTLLTGDIINSGIFGPDGAPDWDGTDLLDVISLQADQRMAFTWQNPFSSFTPSRIDFHIVSNSVMEVEKSFTLNTQAMSSDRLSEYGLQFNDTRFASDHLPKVSDVKLTGVTAARVVTAAGVGLHIFPNPASGEVTVSFESATVGEAVFVLQNTAGQTVRHFEQKVLYGKNAVPLPLQGLPAGVYFLKIKMAGQTVAARIVRQ